MKWRRPASPIGIRSMVPGQVPAEEAKAMIGGDSSYDPYEPPDHEGGDRADGTPQSPSTPQGREPIVPDGRPAAPTAQRPESTGNAGNAEAVERVAGARPAPAAPFAPPEPAGDERVDVALARFEELTAVPVADHVEVFEDVQRRLQDVLASIDHERPPDEASDDSPGAAPRPRPGPGPGSRGA